jgi:hypothetical protein
MTQRVHVDGPFDAIQLPGNCCEQAVVGDQAVVRSGRGRRARYEVVNDCIVSVVTTRRVSRLKTKKGRRIGYGPAVVEPPPWPSTTPTASWSRIVPVRAIRTRLGSMRRTYGRGSTPPASYESNYHSNSPKIDPGRSCRETRVRSFSTANSAGPFPTEGSLDARIVGQPSRDPSVPTFDGRRPVNRAGGRGRPVDPVRRREDRRRSRGPGRAASGRARGLRSGSRCRPAHDVRRLEWLPSPRDLRRRERTDRLIGDDDRLHTPDAASVTFVPERPRPRRRTDDPRRPRGGRLRRWHERTREHRPRDGAVPRPDARREVRRPRPGRGRRASQDRGRRPTPAGRPGRTREVTRGPSPTAGDASVVDPNR